MSTEDRRPAPRLRIQAPMEYDQNDESGRGFTKDVSLSGVRIEQASLAVPIVPEPSTALLLAAGLVALAVGRRRRI